MPLSQYYQECGQCKRQFSATISHPKAQTSGPAGFEWQFCSWECFIAFGEKMETARKKKVADARAAREESYGIATRHAAEGRRRLGLDKKTEDA